MQTFLVILAIVGTPPTVWGAWKFVTAIVHIADSVQTIARSLEREASGNGTVSQAQLLLKLEDHPTTKELVAALVVATFGGPK